MKTLFDKIVEGQIEFLNKTVKMDTELARAISYVVSGLALISLIFSSYLAYTHVETWLTIRAIYGSSVRVTSEFATRTMTYVVISFVCLAFLVLSYMLGRRTKKV